MARPLGYRSLLALFLSCLFLDFLVVRRRGGMDMVLFFEDDSA